MQIINLDSCRRHLSRMHHERFAIVTRYRDRCSQLVSFKMTESFQIHVCSWELALGSGRNRRRGITYLDFAKYSEWPSASSGVVEDPEDGWAEVFSFEVSFDMIFLRVGIKALVDVWRDSVCGDADGFRDSTDDGCEFIFVFRLGTESVKIVDIVIMRSVTKLDWWWWWYVFSVNLSMLEPPVSIYTPAPHS